jgi:hypothetical protein
MTVREEMTGTADPVGHTSAWEHAHRGEPALAWADLLAGVDTAAVFGVSGHALAVGPELPPAAREIGVITVAGHPWTLLGSPGSTHPAPPPEWSVGVAGIRLHLSLWLRDQAVGRLRKRTVGGTALIHQQLVRGELAEAATEQAVARALRTDAADRPDLYPVLTRASRRITVADRILLRLFGAYGYLSDGPGQVAHLSELMADAYLEAAGGEGGTFR